MISFLETSKEQRSDLSKMLTNTVVDWLKKHGVRSGSVLGSYNLYNAVQLVPHDEFQLAKQAKKLAEAEPGEAGEH